MDGHGGQHDGRTQSIIWAKDKSASARFLAHILGVEAGPQWARFVPVRVGGVTLD